MPMTSRVRALRDRALRTRNTGDARVGELHSESLSTTEGEPEVIRAAKATAHYFSRQDITIREGELIVGTQPGLVTDAEEILPAIFGRRAWEPPDPAFWPVPAEAEVHWREGVLAPAGNHTTIDYQTVFAIGFSGLAKRIDKRLAQLEDGGDQRDFLAALRIVAEGYLDLCTRYADEAEALSRHEPDTSRRRELETIAIHCRRTPAQPPRGLWEACQCVWFCFFFLPDAPGRVDQYLHPYYAQDIERGRITRDFAKELLSCLWVKYFESVGATSGVSAHNHLTLGGTTPDGRDAANEVTHLCLEVIEETKLLRPQVGLRWHAGTDPDLLRHAVRALRAGTGSPDFCSDEQIVPALCRVGVAEEDARGFSLSGCHEVIVTGKAQMGSVEGFINMPKLLRMALGLEPGLQPATDLASVATFEGLWARLEESMELAAEAAHLSSLGRDEQAARQPGGDLRASLVVADCIQEARGYTQGGARYNFCNWDIIGTANLADSLAVIRWLLFEERELTLEQLGEILDADWAGHERLRARILREGPHFGNEDATVDALAARVVERFDAIIKRRTPHRGGQYILGTTAGGENMHIEFGRVTGATPDGRHAGQPIADSIGAAQGRDSSGITALLNSVARLPHLLLPTATTLNVKLDPTLLNSDEGIDAIAALIGTHFRSGGQQLQFSFVDRETLEAAKAHPEEHRNLMVRVAGYSAPFVALWEDLQHEIIARTEHTRV